MSSNHQKVQDDFPHEVKQQMKQFQDLLGQLRTALKPLTENRAVKEQPEKAVASAQADLTACYAVNSLFWAYLIVSGQNPKEHDVKRELNRLKVSMSRLREVCGRETARPMRLDVPAASRMLKHSLPADQMHDQGEEEENGRKRKKLKT